MHVLTKSKAPLSEANIKLVESALIVVVCNRICVALIVCACSACASYGAMTTCFGCEISEVGFLFSNFRTASMVDLLFF